MNILYKAIILYFSLFTLLYPTSSQSDKEPIPLEKVTLQLQWKDQFQFAGFYAAKEKGFYKEAGLDVTFKPFVSKLDIIDEVLSKRATYGIAYTEIIARYLRGDPLVFLANFFKQSPLVLVSQAPYKLPSDLKGKKIMASSDTLTLITPLMMLKKFDVGPQDFTAVPPSFDIQDFIEKKVDAASYFLSNETYYLIKAGVKFNILNPANYGIPSYDLNLFTSQEELRTHPKRAAAFREASIRGWEYALAHKEEIIRLILKKYNTQHKSYDALKYEADQIEDMVLPSVYPVGSINPMQVKRIAETMVEMDFLPKETAFDFRSFLYKSPPKNLKLTPEEMDYLVQKKEITYCADPQWMPFSAIQEGNHIGMDADYITFLEKKIGHPFRLIPTGSWEETMEKGKTGECQVLSMTMETPRRTRYFDFTKTFVSTPIVLATTIDKGFIDDLNEVLEKPIGIVRGYALKELLSYKYPHLNIVEVNNINEGLKKVAKRELYAFIDNLTTLGYLIQKEYIGTLKISAKVDMTANFGFAVKKGDPVLLSILNKAIDTIDSGSKQEIYNRWNNVAYDEGFNRNLFGKVLAFFILLLAFIYYHYMKMQKLNRKLHELSTRDALSGLYNRRHIERIIERERNSKKSREYFALILLDIDNFKKINDTCGHDVGDRIIKEIASLLQEHLSHRAIVSRWGGEEFLIFCEKCSVAEAKEEAECLRKAIEMHDFGLEWTITSSFGVAEYPKDKLMQSPYIQKVDRALQQAKAEGKNRVVVYSEEA
jgi:diguanylate cyclase (GGDEF)-like protein